MAKPSWITLSSSNGTGNKTIDVTCSKNSSDARAGVISVSASGIIKTVDISQNAANKYTISCSVSPTDIGATCSIGSSATGGVASGSYYYESQVTLTASAAPTGYTFLGWYEGSNRVTTALQFQADVTGNRTFVAKYQIKSYIISASSENTNYGTVTPATQTINHGSSATVRATRKTGYTFDGWYEGNSKVSSTETYTFAVTSSRTLVAKWKVYNVSMTINISPSGAGTVSPNPATAQEGKEVRVTAIPSTGYKFKHWSYKQNGTGAQNTSSNISETFIAVVGRNDITAVFEKKTYTITLKANDGTFGTANGWTISSDKSTATKTLTHGTAYGTLPTITAPVSNTHNYSFNGYSPACSADTVATASVTHTAQWTETKIEYLVTLDANGGRFTTAENYWSLNSNKTKATQYIDAFTENYGQIPTPVKDSTAQYSYRFTGFDPPCNESTKASSNITHRAQYTTTTRSYTVTLKAGGGTFTATSGWTLSNSNTVATKTVSYGSSVGTLPTISRSSTDQYSYSFKAYSPTVTSTTTVTGNIEATAQWTSSTRSYTWTFDANGGTGDTTKTLNYGATLSPLPTASRTSTAQYSYTFLGWYDTSSSSGGTKLTTSTQCTSNKTWYARWEATTRQYTVTFVKEGDIIQLSKTTQTVPYGGSVSCTATPIPDDTQWDITFNGWYTAANKGGSKITSGTTLEVSNITSDRTYYANASKVKRRYTITANVMSGKGIVNGGGTYEYGSQVVLEAKPSDSYKFARWSDDNTSNPRNIIVQRDATYSAIFEQNAYLDLSTQELTFEASGGTQQIAIRSNVNWTVS